MKNEELQDLYPFENYATLGAEKPRQYRMRWNNNAILYALEYYRMTAGEEATYDILIEKLGGNPMDMTAIIAFIYGAMRAARPSIDYKAFCDIYTNDHLLDNMNAVIDGITHYLPEPDGHVDSGKDLDEDWPDTQAELKKKELSTATLGGSGTGSRFQWLASLLRNSEKLP